MAVAGNHVPVTYVLQLCYRFKIRVPKNCFSIQLGKEHILTRQLLAVVNERGLSCVVG